MNNNPIVITQGDTATLQLACTDGDDVPFDLTGAVLTTYFRDGEGESISIPNSQHTIDPDQVLHRGEFEVDLTVENTDSIPLGQNKEIITKVVQGSSIIYFHGPSLLKMSSKIPAQ